MVLGKRMILEILARDLVVKLFEICIMSYCSPEKAYLLFYCEKRSEHSHLDVQENFMHDMPCCFYVRS